MFLDQELSDGGRPCGSAVFFEDELKTKVYAQQILLLVTS